jgi:hypothetical protein
MSSEGRGDSVSFPDVHLGTAGSILAHGGRGVPIENVSFSIDEFNIMRALSITVASSEFSTSLVARESRFTSVFIHLDEVKSSIDTTIERVNIDCEGEFFVLQFEHFVVLTGLIGHVSSGTNVAAGDEVESQVSAGGGNAIDTSHVLGIDTLKGAVLGTSCRVGAEVFGPRSAFVTIGISTSVMSPSPVAIHSDGSLLRLATSIIGTSTKVHRRMVLRFLVSRLLSLNSSNEESDG